MTGEPDPAAHAGFGRELRIDWIPATLLGGSGGEVGLTGLPGKRGTSQRYPGRVYRRNADDDLAALRAADVRTLILLVEDEELRRWSHLDLAARGSRVGLVVRRHPIPDGQPPPSVASMERILADLDQGRRLGRVAIACMGGVGRSGTVAACALVRAGLDPGAAIAKVRAIRHPSAVETAAQVAFVRAFPRTPPRAATAV